MRFQQAWAFLFLLPLPGLIWYYWFSHIPRKAAVKFSHIGNLKNKKISRRSFRLTDFLEILPLIAYVLFVVALSRPQAGQKGEEVSTEGYDIIMTLDASETMLSEDFAPKNRFEVAKEQIARFVRNRPHDRIGLVVFGRESYVQSPLTLDHSMVVNSVRALEMGFVDSSGTAIGMAIASSVNRLKNSQAKSKIVILLTDGLNNSGSVDPVTAASVAKTLGVKIYTIGVGKRGKAPMPVDHPIFGRQVRMVDVDLDEDTLREVARLTGGVYYRATNPAALENIYKTIDQLEKSRISVKEYHQYNELYAWFLGAGLIILMLYLILDRYVFLTIP